MTARHILLFFAILLSIVGVKLYRAIQPQAASTEATPTERAKEEKPEAAAWQAPSVPVTGTYVSGTKPEPGQSVEVRSNGEATGRIRVMESDGLERNGSCDVDAGGGTVTLTVIETHAGVAPIEREMPTEDDAAFWVGKDDDRHVEEQRLKNTVLIRYQRSLPPSEQEVRDGACPGTSGIAVVDEDYFLHHLARADG